jgi:hypothetical protein
MEVNCILSDCTSQYYAKRGITNFRRSRVRGNGMRASAFKKSSILPPFMEQKIHSMFTRAGHRSLTWARISKSTVYKHIRVWSILRLSSNLSPDLPNALFHAGYQPKLRSVSYKSSYYVLLTFIHSFIHLRFVHSTVVFLHPKLSFAICLCL